MPAKKKSPVKAKEPVADVEEFGEEALNQAVEAFKNGEPIMVFDSAFRERETDLLWPASAADSEVIRRLRKDCGGLLFLAIGNEIGEMFGLPWLQDIHTTAENIARFPVLDELKTNDLQYDTKSAFTLSLNHRDTYTGITDRDRALTTKRFAELVSELPKGISEEDARKALGKEFRTPGHIPVCREAPGGLGTRQGHTELAVSIARLANVAACTIGAEMLEPNGEKSLPFSEALKYAKKHKIPFVTGKDLLKAHKLNVDIVEEKLSKRQKLEAEAQTTGTNGATA
jgi:3,4-dihydroxy 2-butanone 4-phosphate synthase